MQNLSIAIRQRIEVEILLLFTAKFLRTFYCIVIEDLEILLLPTANFLAFRKYFYFLPPKKFKIC
jgi:hypothetical protein